MTVGLRTTHMGQTNVHIGGSVVTMGKTLNTDVPQSTQLYVGTLSSPRIASLKG